MANEQNLIPNNMRSPSEVRENGRKGGKASGKARREKKLMREALEVLLSRNYTDRNGQQVDGTMALMVKTYQMAMDGDMRAIEFIRATTGQDPVQRIETTTIPQEAYERVRKVLDGFENDDDNGVQLNEGS